MNANFVGPESATSLIVIDDASYSVCESDEVVVFKRTGDLERIGLARACYMTTSINVFKISFSGEEVYCGEIEMPDDESEVDSELLNRQCIEMILDSEAV